MGKMCLKTICLEELFDDFSSLQFQRLTIKIDLANL